jgi:hypothetical protein
MTFLQAEIFALKRKMNEILLMMVVILALSAAMLWKLLFG